ncbi:hypothetical protein B0T14DRAFT_209281 [Immersiella caudata]|uniref:Secreted protein n=1 Tax=Immersiella caudata TaxID=314043 RepID=A0AA40BZR7_9PEZI|nr:hypothetical protein B0T14DRAFT_209281 [Immersiella caudata]
MAQRLGLNLLAAVLCVGLCATKVRSFSDSIEEEVATWCFTGRKRVGLVGDRRLKGVIARDVEGRLSGRGGSGSRAPSAQPEAARLTA